MNNRSGHDDVVRSERRGAVAILRINRPEARNALNAAAGHAASAADRQAVRSRRR